MNKMRVWFEQWLLSPIHPLLFAIYYALRMYVFNIHGIPFRDFIRPLLISVFAAGALFTLCFLFIRRKHSAAFMTSSVLFMFYFYYNGWSLLPIQKTHAQAARFPVIWALLTLLVVFWLARNSHADQNVNAIAGVNLMALTLLLFPVMQGIRYAIADSQSFLPQVRHVVAGKQIEALPDIYYVILDAYPRADVLNQYGYDNGQFIQDLKDMGFYVAACSQSNYSNTAPSLTSSLNMDYLQTLSATIRPEEDDLWGTFKMLDENAARASAVNMGYKTTSFASGFLWAEWRDADVFIAPPDGPMTEFETTVLLSSYARTLNDLGYVNVSDIHAERFRTRTRLILESFDALALQPGPKFVFIHLIVPHAPFAFDENGNPANPNQFRGNDGYVTQVKFINKFILPGLRTLIEKSPQPPVIILQGDHGPLDKNLQMRILNAYYLPRGAEALYPGISPVNSFRVVFNAYFDADLPLLEDISYYSSNGKYDFSVIPNTCPP